MAKAISWGKPGIYIGATGQTLGNSSAFELLSTPVEDSTQLTGTQGDKTEATIEGGEAEATRLGAATFELAMNVRMALEDNDKHRILPLELYAKIPTGQTGAGNPDITKFTTGSVSVVLIPAEPNAPGFYCPTCAVSITETYTAADGAMWEIVLAPNVPSDGGKAVRFGKYTATKKQAQTTVGDFKVWQYTIADGTSGFLPTE
jgi:hypothetical protein